MNSNRQLFNRMTIYIIVFVLVTVSYINFTKSKDDNLNTNPDVATTKAVESPEEDIENLDEEMVLGEVDIEDLEVQEIEEEG